MAKIHNQRLLESNVGRCDTLAAGVIERRDAMLVVRAEICSKQTLEVLDYIFGKSDVNPLAESSEYLQADMTEYKDRCREMTDEVLKSNNKKEQMA